MKYLIGLLLIMASGLLCYCLACTSAEIECTCQLWGAEHPTTWAAEALAGKRLVIVSDVKVADLRFDEHSVVATFGLKDGPVTAPAFYWRIEKDMLILSDEPNGKSVFSLGVISRKGNVLTATEPSGETVRYTISSSLFP